MIDDLFYACLEFLKLSLFPGLVRIPKLREHGRGELTAVSGAEHPLRLIGVDR